MMEMLVMLASIMTTEQCIDRLQTAIDEYKEAQLINADEEQLEKKKGELILSTHLLTLHMTTGKKGMDGAFDTIQRLKEIKKADEFFKTPKN